MKRRHFFEFVDQNWIPALIRNSITQITQFNIDFFKIYDPVSSIINELIKTTGNNQIIDLCSGSSGPWPRLISQIASPVKVTLTDKFPNLKKWEQIAQSSGAKISYSKTPVDVHFIPDELKGIRTIFTGFHHFKLEEARSLLIQTVARDQPIAIFEFTERSLISMLRGLILFILLPFFQTPFIKPRSIAVFFWTYCIPLIPILHYWDGLISNIRTYSVNELWEIVNSTDWKKYHWEIGSKPIRTHGMKGNITYLVGYNPHRSYF